MPAVEGLKKITKIKIFVRMLAFTLFLLTDIKETQEKKNPAPTILQDAEIVLVCVFTKNHK